jgi:hypothetical protein
VRSLEEEDPEYRMPQGKESQLWEVSSIDRTRPMLSPFLRLQQTFSRLAISDHGSPGEFSLVGATPSLNYDSIDQYKNQLGSIRGFLTGDAVVLLVGCNCAMGGAGSRFLNKLSTVLSGKKVVGFTTVGFEGHQR